MWQIVQLYLLMYVVWGVFSVGAWGVITFCSLPLMVFDNNIVSDFISSPWKLPWKVKLPLAFLVGVLVFHICVNESHNPVWWCIAVAVGIFYVAGFLWQRNENFHFCNRRAMREAYADMETTSYRNSNGDY